MKEIKKKILIIDDDPLVASLYRGKLEKEGYVVDVATDGQQGFYRIHEFKPDAILLDLMLPQINGVDIIRKLRAQKAFQGLPVVVFSNVYVTTVVNDAIQAGATKVFNKAEASPLQVVNSVRELLFPAMAASQAAAAAGGVVVSGAVGGTTMMTRTAQPAQQPSAGNPGMPTAPGTVAPASPTPGPSAVSASGAPQVAIPNSSNTISFRNPLVRAGSHPGGSSSLPKPAGLPGSPSTVPKPPANAAPPSHPPAPIPFSSERPGFAPPPQPSTALPGPGGISGRGLPHLAAPTGQSGSAPGPGASAGLRPSPGSNSRPVPSSHAPPPAVPVTPTVDDSDEFRASLRQAFFDEAPGTIALLRKVALQISKADTDATKIEALQAMYRKVQGSTGNASLAGLVVTSQFCAVLEAFLRELEQKPKNLNASTLRTIAQAVDFLGILLERRDLDQSKELEQPCALVVDDEAISRRAVVFALNKAKVTPVDMEDPTAALAKASASKFDLIYLDVDMPGMNGFELCTKIRASGMNKATPVVFVTSLSDFESKAKSTLSGGSDLIAKPFMFNELALKTLTYIMKSRLAAASPRPPGRP